MATSVISSPNILITGGTFQQYNTNFKGSLDRLLETASPAAFHNSNDRRDPPKCHPKTRVAVLKKILDWIHGLEPEMREAFIMWIHGPAGSGKSAIAQSIAEICCEEGILVASYFFSRFDSTRNHARSVIATISYQASLCFPDIRDKIIAAIDLDPLIFSRSLDAQILALLIQPLRQRVDSGYFNTTAATRVVILDGLDECEDCDGQIEILTTISNALTHHHLPLIFVIASRPEHDITTAFGLSHLSDISIRNPLDHRYLPCHDIFLFLQDTFSEIKQNHPFRAQIPSTWPADDVLRSLASNSSGQFIYASTVVKFVKSTRHRPPQRLDIVLGVRSAHGDMPFSALDALYMHILSSVADPESVVQVLALHFVTLYPPFVNDMEKLLSFNAGDISLLLCDLTSLISIREHRNDRGENRDRLFIHHACLQDFLLDQSRSKQFWINSPLRHAEFAHLSFHHLQDGSKHSDLALLNLLDHIANAAPTQELHSDMVESSFGKFLVEWPSPFACRELGYFFTSLKRSKFDDATVLHNHQLQLFDLFAQGIMEKMFSDAGLTALVAITNMRMVPFHDRNGAMTILFKMNDARRALDRLSFCGNVWFSREYGSFILQFLKDPTRSGKYMLNGDRYAIAAVHLLKHICNHSEQVIRSRYTLRRKYQRRRNTPWLWRKNVEKINPPEAARVIQREAKRRMRALQGDHPSTFAAIFSFALSCLSYVLLRSDSSDELIALAGQRIFGPLSRKFPRRKRIVKDRIAQYLERVRSEDRSSF